ncbi:hypothetical protein XENOCAPTIV_006027, partial [Xenoophorus captivus]
NCDILMTFPGTVCSVRLCSDMSSYGKAPAAERTLHTEWPYCEELSRWACTRL